MNYRVIINLNPLPSGKKNIVLLQNLLLSNPNTNPNPQVKKNIALLLNLQPSNY